jgi:adenylate kinase
VIVLDLVSEPALSEQVLQILTASETEEEKVVIGLSTIMTWARTSPVSAEEGEEEDEDKALTEEDYKRRRPHVNFRDQHTLEKLLVRSKTETVRTHVVCAGLLYGGAEELLHPLFKLAWHNKPLPLLSLKGDGANVLPTIHVADLCSVLLKVVEGEGPSYIVAVDDAREQTLAKVTHAIAKHLGTGEVSTPSADEVMLGKDVDYFQIDLKIQPTSVAEMGIEWVARSGFVRNVQSVVAEFRKARAIEPLKLLLVGTLAGVSGCLESEVAAAIAREYKVAHVTTASLIAEAVGLQSELSDKVRAAKASDKQNTGNLPDELLVQLVRNKLNSTVCTNQGWVLDGYPYTLPQLKLLAPEKADDDDEVPEAEDGDEEDEDKPKAQADLTPEHVLIVRSADDQLKQRVQAMGQPQVEATGMTAEQLLKRMQLCAQANAPEGPNNVLMHKALKEIEPLEMDVDPASDGAEPILARARVYLGKPRNYGPTEAETKAREERLAALAAEAEAKSAALAAQRLEVRARAAAWAEKAAGRAAPRQWVRAWAGLLRVLRPSPFSRAILLLPLASLRLASPRLASPRLASLFLLRPLCARRRRRQSASACARLTRRAYMTASCTRRSCSR